MAFMNPINKPDCLEQLCASNYQNLFKLIPDLLSYKSNAIGQTANNSPLRVQVISRSAYTMTVQLTYRFNKNLREFFEPAVMIRVYLDVKLAEVLSDHARAPVSLVFKDPGLSFEIMNYKWRLNYFLYKWLDHCLNKNYQFNEETLKPVTVEETKEFWMES